MTIESSYKIFDKGGAVEALISFFLIRRISFHTNVFLLSFQGLSLCTQRNYSLILDDLHPLAALGNDYLKTALDQGSISQFKQHNESNWFHDDYYSVVTLLTYFLMVIVLYLIFL